MRLSDFAFERICDQFDYYEQGLATKKEALKQIAKIVSFELEVAQGVGYNEGYYARTDEGLREVIADVNYIPDSQLLALNGTPSGKLVDYTEEHQWRAMLTAEARMIRRHNDSI